MDDPEDQVEYLMSLLDEIEVDLAALKQEVNKVDELRSQIKFFQRVLCADCCNKAKHFHLEHQDFVEADEWRTRENERKTDAK